MPRLPNYLRLVALVIATLILAGCTGMRPTALVLQPVAVAAPPRTVEVLAITNRQKSTDGGFAPVRADGLWFERYRISLPKGPRSTEIGYPGPRPDPTRNYVVLSRESLTQAQFIAAARRTATRGSTAALYVHGYNQTYQEALFRLAQVSGDSGQEGPAILFSWPTEASVFGYGADHDHSLSSRDDLAKVLRLLTREGGFRQLVVAAHSMGSFLVMETVRQLALRNDTPTLNKLAVVLAAPDIDAEVFETQLESIGAASPPIVVMVSRQDRALAISSDLNGNRTRVGLMGVDDPMLLSAVRRFGITVIDITQAAPDDPFQHDGFASMAKFAKTLANAEGKSISIIAKAGLLVFDATKVTLSLPTLAGQ